ncbi:MAG: hypothetical protein AAGA03_14880, partial [Planctomycetota bacterium]
MPTLHSASLPIVLAWLTVANSLQGGVILENDFDAAGLNGQFTGPENAFVLGPTTTAPDGFLSGNALHFGSRAGARRTITTIPVDVSSGGSIRFDFRGGNEAEDGSVFWENSNDGPSPDPFSEVMELSYSTDGSNYFSLSTFSTTTTPNWIPVSINLPSAAESSTTTFRWFQSNNTGAAGDNW